MKYYPKMSPDQFAALKEQALRHDKADREVDASEHWGDAHWNATHERMSAMGAWLDLLPYRLFWSERDAAIKYTRGKMELAHQALQDRIQDFRGQGKQVWALTEMYYMPGGGYFRVMMRVEGNRYCWVRYGMKSWRTGDNLDLQAAAARTRGNWDTMPEVSIQCTTPTKSWVQPARRWADVVFITAYTHIALEELVAGTMHKEVHLQIIK